jgi:hypothetical protein
MAAKILSDIFQLEEGKPLELAALTPAKGSFQFISSLDFGRDIPAALATAPVEGVAETRASEGPPKGAAPPTVRPPADAEGTVVKKPNLFQRLFGGGKKKEKNGKKTRP